MECKSLKQNMSKLDICYLLPSQSDGVTFLQGGPKNGPPG